MQVQRATSCDLMDITEVRQITDDDVDRFTEFEKRCSICLVPWAAGDWARELPCGHVFHPGCVDPWLKDQPKCAVCMKPVIAT